MIRKILSLMGILSAIYLSTTIYAQDKPSICFVTNWCNGEQEDVPLVAELRNHGFLVDNIEFHLLTAEKMQQYNAIIFPEFPRTDSFAQSDCNWSVRPQTLVPFYEAIEKYVKDGGGVVQYGVCFFQTQKNGMENMNKMLAPWGAQTLFEQVTDPERLFQYRQQYSYDYSWTTNLAKSPLTEGLKAVFYTRSQQHGPTTCTFKLSKDWNVLVSGEKGSFSVNGDKFDEDTNTTVKGNYESAPPIIAERTYGKGRIALIGVTPVMSVFAARFLGHGSVLMDEGTGTLKSDFGKLQERLYRWVAEPALKAGKPGGFAGKPVEFAVNPDLNNPPFKWKDFNVGGETNLKAFRGTIGARTKLTGGKGSVKEYVSAAKAAGLDYIGFAEDFTKLTPEKWEAFKTECKEASDDKFLAVSGFVFQDNVNAQWVTIGSFKYPDKSKLSEDGKKIIDPNWWFDADTPLTGPFDVSHNPRPFWDYALYSGIAVEFCRNGKVIDTSLDPYLDRSEVENLLAPMVVDLIESPSQINNSKLTCGLFANIAALESKINRSMGIKSEFFATTGPILTDWRAWNQGRTTQGRREDVPGTELMAVYFVVKSDKGIKSVKLMDGPHVLRNFSANGQKEFSQLVMIPHDRQRHLLVMAEDTAGGKLVSGQFPTADQLNWRFMCADNGNSICDSVLKTSSGRVYITGPVAPYQRTTTMFSFTPGIADLSVRFAAPYVDGGVRLVPHSGIPQVAIKGVKLGEGDYKSKMGHPLSSLDVIIQQNQLIGWTDFQYASAWHPAREIKKLNDFETSIRWIDFAKRDHDPGFTLVEGKITFLRDLELDSAVKPNPIIDYMIVGSTDFMSPIYSLTGIEGVPGNALSGITQKNRPQSYEGAIKVGGFAAFLPYYSGSGAIIPLDDGYRIQALMNRPTSTVSTGLDLGGKKFKKGDVLKYRLLTCRGVIDAEPSDREWRDFVSKMGLSGKPEWTPTMQQGKLLSTKYIMETEAADGGVAFKVAKVQLPVLLPITVEGLNPKITAGMINMNDGSYSPVGVIELEGKAYTVWDCGKAEAELYIGNLVLCDSKDLIITAVRIEKDWMIDVHNPTSNKISATVQGPKRVKVLSQLNQKVEVPPGQSLKLNVTGN